MKAEWPKFSGDSNKFRAWYLGIMTQMSLPPWQELYDPIKHDVVNTTQNVTLNGKLYSKTTWCELAPGRVKDNMKMVNRETVRAPIRAAAFMVAPFLFLSFFSFLTPYFLRTFSAEFFLILFASAEYAATGVRFRPLRVEVVCQPQKF